MDTRVVYKSSISYQNMRDLDEVRIVYETIASKYEKTFKGENEFMDKFAELLPPNSRVLDLGCGTGGRCEILGEERV